MPTSHDLPPERDWSAVWGPLLFLAFMVWALVWQAGSGQP